MVRYHEVKRNGLCLTCNKWCEYCNQCRCEIGRKRICPGFDVKKHPARFEHWKLELEIERVERTLLYGVRYSPAPRRRLQERLAELLQQKEQLAAGD